MAPHDEITISGLITSNESEFKYNNCVYKGEHRDGMADGEGTLTYPDGEYKGQWRTNNRHGHGVLTMRTGGSYTGEWLDDYKHGWGVEVYSNRVKIRHLGDGIMAYEQVDFGSYEGQFHMGVRHGEGTITYQGKTYPCRWKHGTMVPNDDK